MMVAWTFRSGTSAHCQMQMMSSGKSGDRPLGMISDMSGMAAGQTHG
jgi:hypothetical protein